MKELLINFLIKELKLNLDFNSLLESPKQQLQGDIALPCFIFSKELRKNPIQIAEELKKKLSKKLPEFIEKIENSGPYLNFFYNPHFEIKETFKSIESKKAFNIKSKKKPLKIVIEYPSPNTNKSLHLGHLRNILLGNSLSKILERSKNKVIRVNLNNDKGIAICKAMLAYQMFGRGKTPKTEKIKSDKFVANYYVRFEIENKKNPKLKLEEKAQEMLLSWERGEKETIKLWEKLMSWVFEGYKETYSNFNVKHNKEYFESDIWNKGKEIVLKGLKENIKGFGKEEDGAVFCDLSDINLDKKYLLRKDGTTLYMTQDLYLAKQKQKDFNADKYITITSNEQDYHFQVLFELLDRLKISSKEKNIHYSYGYISLPSGKMKSREGTVVDCDELLNEVVKQAKENLLSREISKNLSEKELKRRSVIIGHAAISFLILKFNPKSDFVFNPKESLSMRGETGPYVQYTYARIKSILRKSNIKATKPNYNLFTQEKEINLIKLLGRYNEMLIEAHKDLKPSTICNYLIKLCQEFNTFYSEVPILNATNKEIVTNRLYLIETITKVIKDGLDLLGIQTLEEM